MAPIGQAVSSESKTSALKHGRLRASLVPDLLAETSAIVNTVVAGWHGRRRRGIGETFWQYRPYQQGETMARIDWRRSARDDQTYVRDLEWEVAHTVWIWADLGPSMLFQSKGTRASKELRALVIALAMAEILSRSGERVGCPSIMRPTASRNGAERLAHAMAQASESLVTGIPALNEIQRHSDIVLISDFLSPREKVMEMLDAIVQRGARPHLVEICDPVEEVFPYKGRTEFRDPVTGEKLTAGRAQDYQQEYRNLYLARREELRLSARKHGGSYTVSHTDRLASEALVQLHAYLSGNPAIAGARQQGAA